MTTKLAQPGWTAAQDLACAVCDQPAILRASRRSKFAPTRRPPPNAHHHRGGAKIRPSETRPTGASSGDHTQRKVQFLAVTCITWRSDLCGC